nr:MAG TPA: hypothetical protein [Caudoviricetes sp.]
MYPSFLSFLSFKHTRYLYNRSRQSYLFQHCQMRNKKYDVMIECLVFPVFIPIKFNAFLQSFFCDIQIFCNLMAGSTTMFVCSDQTLQLVIYKL